MQRRQFLKWAVLSGAVTTVNRISASQAHQYGPFYRDLIGGFLGLEIDEKTLRGQFRDIDGAILHEWVQTPRG